VLLETDITGASRLLRLSWDEAWELKRRAVERGRARKAAQPPARAGVDETAWHGATPNLTLVCDLERGTVEYLAEDRKQASLDAYFTALTPDQRGQIKAIAMDMWESYVQSVLAYVPQAETKIVFDRFHIMQHMNEAVDKVRRREHRELRQHGDDTLTGSKCLWRQGEENVPEPQRERFEVLRGRQLKLRTARAWAIKESLRDLWRCRGRAQAEGQWRWWYGWASRSRLPPVRKVAKMLRRHLPNVLTYFRHRITNAMSEGIAAKIQAIKKMACGFRNRENFKTAIYFHCGGLDLYPATH
jgi:transposase